MSLLRYLRAASSAEHGGFALLARAAALIIIGLAGAVIYLIKK